MGLSQKEPNAGERQRMETISQRERFPAQLQAPAARVVVPFSPCTSCECAEYLCEEHRRAHGKTRVTKGHTVTHVRNLRLTEEMVTVEEEAEVPLVAAVAHSSPGAAVKEEEEDNGANLTNGMWKDANRI